MRDRPGSGNVQTGRIAETIDRPDTVKSCMEKRTVQNQE